MSEHHKGWRYSLWFDVSEEILTQKEALELDPKRCTGVDSLETLGKGPTSTTIEEWKRKYVKETVNIGERKTTAQGSCEGSAHNISPAQNVSPPFLCPNSTKPVRYRFKCHFLHETFFLSFLSPKFHNTFHTSQFLIIYTLKSSYFMDI